MTNSKGEILPIVIVAVATVLIFTIALISGASLYYSNSSYSVLSEKATALAEAGADKTIQSLNKSGGNYSGETETFFGDGSFSVTITTKDAGTKIIESTGYIPNKTSPKAKRTVRVEASKGIGVSFVYGLQVGEGGLQLGNENLIKGTIYSNGSIIGGNNNTIEGDAWVAGGPQPNPDQQTDCSGVNCQDFLFGKIVSGENRMDVAQSFKPIASNVLSKVSLKIKKIGNPASDPTVRILKDDNGVPDKNNVLATGTLFNSLVTSQYGFIDVTFDSTPSLNANTTYWVMVDTCGSQTNCNSSDYWSWQNDLAGSYTSGFPAFSPRWNARSPIWVNFAGDLSFKTYLGGVATKIQMGNNSVVKNDVHANTIDGLTIQKDAYYQTIINSSVGGISHPGSADPPPKVFPISDANITEWREEAETAGLITFVICTSGQTLGPGKLIGNFILGNNCSLTIKTPIWITGNIIFGNGNTLTLDSGYGSASGVIVIDGTSSFGNTNKLKGTGVGSSLLMLLSTYDSISTGTDAITIGNVGNSGVFYAGKGIIDPGNSNQYKELTAWRIDLTNNSTIDYETGLSSTLFSSGPGGTYTLVKGTYQVK